MAQIKIYGRREQLDPIKARLSEVIHDCVVEALKFPPDKRFHRFFPLAAEDFFTASDRSPRYTIIEISMMTGRTRETKKRLIELLFERVCAQFDLPVADLEISIHESPPENWGFRGQSGDEIALNYRVEI